MVKEIMRYFLSSIPIARLMKKLRLQTVYISSNSHMYNATFFKVWNTIKYPILEQINVDNLNYLESYELVLLTNLINKLFISAIN